MNANYTLNTFANGFGRWYCRITFAHPGLGNTRDAERLAHNAIANAKRRIRKEITERMAGKPKRLSYAVVNNESQLGSGRMLSLTIAEK